MDLNVLLNYGVLGLWTAFLLYEKQQARTQQQASEARLEMLITTSTAAMQKLSDEVAQCPIRR